VGVVGVIGFFRSVVFFKVVFANLSVVDRVRGPYFLGGTISLEIIWIGVHLYEARALARVRDHET
jgi:hypothetical protein